MPPVNSFLRHFVFGIAPFFLEAHQRNSRRGGHRKKARALGNKKSLEIEIFSFYLVSEVAIIVALFGRQRSKRQQFAQLIVTAHLNARGTAWMTVF